MTDPVFFVPTRRYTAVEVANLAGAELADPEHSGIEIAGIASAAEGGKGMLVYIEGKRNARPCRGARRRRRVVHRRHRSSL